MPPGTPGKGGNKSSVAGRAEKSLKPAFQGGFSAGDYHLGMATVNVYTYYTHKLAHESMPRAKAKRRPLRLPRLHPLLVTAVLVLLWLRFLPPAQPMAALTGAGLALGVLFILKRIGIRTRKVWRALNGMSLGLDDLDVLCGH